MTMPAGLRKLALTVHVASSVGWLGAVAGFLALAVAGVVSDREQTVRAAYVATELITWTVIVPLCFASLLSGLVQSLGTPWGLFRHYWVVAKLLLTGIATVVLLLQTAPIEHLGGLAAESPLSPTDFPDGRISLVVHAVGGLLVLILTTLLSVYKPRGLTRYGWRKQEEQRSMGKG